MADYNQWRNVNPMGEHIDKAQISLVANELMLSGKHISVDSVARHLDVEVTQELTDAIEQWWLEHESLVSLPSKYKKQNRPSVPETVYQSVQLIWENALKDAKLELEIASQQPDNSKSSSASLEDELYLSKAQLEAVEESNQRLRGQLTETQHNIKNLEAERAMLRSNLQAAETNISAMTHKVAESKGEMQRAQASSEEAKKQLETRMKEEGAHHQQSISKVKNKMSYYSHQLEKLRDEWGKKEAALNSQIQDLQGELARGAVTQDTQFSQIRSQEEELRKYRGEITSQSRNMSKSTSQALASTNRLKRLESELQQREFDIKELKNRMLVDKADTTRRETDLRTLLKTRDAENFEMNSKVNELQRALIAREEEIRRLSAKL